MAKNYFILIFVLVLVLITTGCGGVAPPISDLPEWTIMVYLDGDNDLEKYAIDDFLEMASVGSTSDVNIIVFGHSHQPMNKVIHGILFFNPGQARNSFGILTIGEEVKGEILRVR